MIPIFGLLEPRRQNYLKNCHQKLWKYDDGDDKTDDNDENDEDEDL